MYLIKWLLKRLSEKVENRRRRIKKVKHVNSHPAKAPHMVPLVMHYELSSSTHWGWPSGIASVPTSARRGFETVCNDFFIFALDSIAEIPTWIFYDRD